MEKTIITTGKTIDLAIEAALQQLSLDRDSVSVQVLTQAKPGFLGFGATPARVQVTYEAPDPVPEAPKSALTSASRSKPKPTYIAPKQEQPKPVAPKAETPKAEKPTPKAEKTYTPAEAGSTEEKIETFIKGLLMHMGSTAVPHAVKADNDTYNVDLVGDDLGFLIGRRGDTLDAIQHLANYSINHGISGHIRINVDAEEYRQKREDSLRRYAVKKAQQVLKAHRRTTLEPMNAYERHLIHAALQDMDRITTYSVGTEPNRRVVIEYVR
ncbi:MAG: Jag N-terminal domain-containing protein [Oscillospiraceae bacterium]|nr:Jag N-terminal domain-containing protein [Oscillospiraceae bacterium]